MANSTSKTRLTRAAAAVRIALVVTALLLPTLSLVPLGGLYLWQHGYLLHWALAAAVTVFIVFVLQRYLLADSTRMAEAGIENGTVVPDPASTPHPAWSASELDAWNDVQTIARTVNLKSLTNAQAFLDLGHRTINTVARRIHGERDDALWRFTMPEALAITERVSARLGTFIQESIPFGDRLTVAQVLQIYKWRTLADIAEKAFDIWRIVRLGNPATAITHEARERLSRALVQWGHEHVSRRLAETFVEEVGRAAIDLYGGRLRLSDRQIGELALTPAEVGDAAMTIDEPVRLSIVSNDADRVQALYALLHNMESQRIAAVTDFVRGENYDERLLRVAPLDVSVANFSELDSDAPAAPSLVAQDTSVILFIPSDPRSVPESEQQALKKVMASIKPVPAVILPIVDHVVAARQTTEGLVRQLHAFLPATDAAHIAMPAAVSFVKERTANDQRALWDALSAIAIHTRRVHLLRRLHGSKGSGGWGRSARQAASAVGRLSKSLLRRS